MKAILRVARAELRRFFTPTYALAAIVLPLVFSAFTTSLTYNNVGTGQLSSPGGTATTMAQLVASDGWFEGVSQSFGLLGVISVVLSAMTVATDYGNGTLRNLLVRQPNRLILLGGKFMALIAIALTISIAATLSGTLTAHFVASGAGVDTAGWVLHSLPSRIVGLAVGLFGWAAIGALVGTVLRSVPAAIGVSIGWALPIETIIGASSKTVKDWLPGGVFQAVAASGTPSLALQKAITVGMAYLAIALGAALVVFKRRDMTS
jgi:ABC-2 type transport system permease protein